MVPSLDALVYERDATSRGCPRHALPRALRVLPVPATFVARGGNAPKAGAFLRALSLTFYKTKGMEQQQQAPHRRCVRCLGTGALINTNGDFFCCSRWLLNAAPSPQPPTESRSSPFTFSSVLPSPPNHASRLHRRARPPPLPLSRSILSLFFTRKCRRPKTRVRSFFRRRPKSAMELGLRRSTRAEGDATRMSLAEMTRFVVWCWVAWPGSGA